MSWPGIATGHSVEVEHRLTVLEQFREHQLESNAKMQQRLTLQERALLAIIMVLNALAHDKLPEWAKIAASVFKAAQPAG